MRAYVDQLEAEANELREENMALMEARAAALSGKSPSPVGVIAVMAGAGTMPPELYDADLPTSARSEDTVSIMSYSDSEAAVTPSTGGQQALRRARSGMGSGAGLTSASPAVSFGRAGPAGAVAALNAEMEKKSALFDDDAAFITEVHQGVSSAPSMDPHLEIERLMYRFKGWTKDFKGRLKATQVSLKKHTASISPMGSQGNSYFSSPRPSSGVAQQNAAPAESGGLTARLRKGFSIVGSKSTSTRFAPTS
jgi:hypothetical protein